MLNPSHWAFTIYAPQPSSAPTKREGALPGRRRAADPTDRADAGQASSPQGGLDAPRGAHSPSHVLFALGDAWGPSQGNPGAGWAHGPVDDAALHALESRSARCGDSAPGATCGTDPGNAGGWR